MKSVKGHRRNSDAFGIGVAERSRASRNLIYTQPGGFRAEEKARGKENRVLHINKSIWVWGICEYSIWQKWVQRVVFRGKFGSSRMVLPIVIGLGATIAALTAKSTISAYRKYLLLTPYMIASLNNIRLNSPTPTTEGGKLHPHDSIHRFLRQKYPRTGFNDKMTEQEALMIMGIEGDEIMHMDKKLLKERYRKLMVMNHPDKQGSQYLSQKINQAKDILDKSYLFKK